MVHVVYCLIMGSGNHDRNLILGHGGEMNNDNVVMATAQLKIISQGCQQYEQQAKTVYQLLDGSARDTLVALIKQGPLWDGDVPSKVGRDTLVYLGLASKVVVNGMQGYQAATNLGFDVWLSKDSRI